MFSFKFQKPFFQNTHKQTGWRCRYLQETISLVKPAADGTCFEIHNEPKKVNEHSSLSLLKKELFSKESFKNPEQDNCNWSVADNFFDGITTERKWKKRWEKFRDKFSALSERLQHFISDGTNPLNYTSLSVEKKTSFCLNYLKDTGYIWIVVNTFGIHQSTVSKLLVGVCQVITYIVGSELVQLPSDSEQMKKKLK